MIYMHLKSGKNLQRMGKKIMISIKCKRKIYIFSKKSNKYHTNHREISYKKHKHTHKKYLKTYGNKKNFSKT